MTKVIMQASKEQVAQMEPDIARWTRKEIGEYGELMAKSYLERRGYEIVQQNWRCKAGEIDLIAKEEDELVLVEVKTRVSLLGNLDAVMPELAVDGRKRRKYRRLALYYVADHPWMERIRLDVIAVTLRNASEGRIHHVLNAFDWSD